MRIRRLFIAAAALLLAALPAHAGEHAQTHPLQAAFTAYGNTGEGWTGGDGTYSVPLPDGRTAWLFSDTFLGPVFEDGSRPSSAPLIHNSLVIEDGDDFSTITSTDILGGRPRAAADTPDRVTWYWLGDGTVEQNELRVFLFRFTRVPGPLLFQQIGVDLARFSLPDLTLIGIEQMPQAFLPGRDGMPASYGAALLEQEEYTYVYGVADFRFDKVLTVARVPAGDITAPWEYRTATGWSPYATDAVRLLGGVANEMSVTPWNGSFLLVAQENSIGPDVVAYDAPAPWGPFTNKRSLFTIPERGGTLVSYNAKAHPGRAAPGRLLVTYNVNSTSFSDLYRDVSIYRPRFVELTP